VELGVFADDFAQVDNAMTKEFASSDERVAGHDEAARKAMQELWDEATGGGSTRLTEGQ